MCTGNVLLREYSFYVQQNLLRDLVYVCVWGSGIQSTVCLSTTYPEHCLCQHTMHYIGTWLDKLVNKMNEARALKMCKVLLPSRMSLPVELSDVGESTQPLLALALERERQKKEGEFNSVVSACFSCSMSEHMLHERHNNNIILFYRYPDERNECIIHRILSVTAAG